jgi:ankyrin repeat protein
MENNKSQDKTNAKAAADYEKFCIALEKVAISRTAAARGRARGSRAHNVISIAARKNISRADYIDKSNHAKLKLLKSLIIKGADVELTDNYSFTPLMIASMYGDMDMVRFLIARGADVNLTTRDFYGTPLLLAASNGHLNVVKYLVENGADVNQKNELARTPLMEAVEYKHLDIVNFLKTHGAKK